MYGGLSEDEDYAWEVRMTKGGASIVEIIIDDTIPFLDDDKVGDIVKTLRGL